jgi:hypothetical protein
MTKTIPLVIAILEGVVNIIRAVRCKFSSTCCKSDCQTNNQEPCCNEDPCTCKKDILDYVQELHDLKEETTKESF